jgi:hypothetical protein
LQVEIGLEEGIPAMFGDDPVAIGRRQFGRDLRVGRAAVKAALVEPRSMSVSVRRATVSDPSGVWLPLG